MKTFIFPVIIGICILALGLGMNACKSKESTKQTADISYADNVKNLLDWAGTYAGVVPCADCSGIFTQIILKKDNAYNLQIEYLGSEKPTEKFEGVFQWNDAGNIITLSGLKEKSLPSFYLLGENKLIQLDLEGKIIPGDSVSNYILTKINEKLVEKKWKLFELAGVAISQKNSQSAVEAFITFSIKGNQVNGNSGCNYFVGTYKTGPENRLHFSGMASTRKMCLDMSIEDQMNLLFKNVDSYTLQNDTLNLDKSGVSLARFVAE